MKNRLKLVILLGLTTMQGLFAVPEQVQVFEEISYAEKIQKWIKEHPLATIFGLVAVGIGGKSFYDAYQLNKKNELKKTKKEKDESTNLGLLEPVINVRPLDERMAQAEICAEQLEKTFHDFFGYYRNSSVVFQNLAQALRFYAKYGTPHGQINAKQACGQFSTMQSDELLETFKRSLDRQDHGGVLQTMEAIRLPRGAVGEQLKVLQRSLYLIKEILLAHNTIE